MIDKGAEHHLRKILERESGRVEIKIEEAAWDLVISHLMNGLAYATTRRAGITRNMFPDLSSIVHEGIESTFADIHRDLNEAWEAMRAEKAQGQEPSTTPSPSGEGDPGHGP